MKKATHCLSILALMTAGVFSAAAYADHHENGLDICVKNALEAHPGDIVSLRAEIENNNHQFELDINGDDGKMWEVECDSKTGKILEVERSVAADDAEFTSQAKISPDEALKTALAVHSGVLLNIEYEIEPEGGASYEFDIQTDDGQVWEIEVDAVTGETDPAEKVLYQIGGY